MRVLSIGSDRLLFEPGSDSMLRQAAYRKRFDELHIIVFSRRNDTQKTDMLAAGVRIYPTVSRNRWFYGLDAFRIARRLPRPEVVTVQDPFESGLVGVLIAWWHRAPLHVQVHTDFLSPAFASSRLNRIRIRIAGLVLGRAVRVRVVSDRIKQSILARYRPSADIAVLPIFVDMARFRDAHPGDLIKKFVRFTKKLLVVSRLEEEKNVTLAIEGFVKAAPRDACLIIVGEGSERVKLERMAPPNVFFEGFQDPAPYYALADLVLLTSRYEGYGRTIVEALAAGKPVLSTDVGVAREVGAIVTDGDFAQSLAAWLAQGPYRGELDGYPYPDFESYADAYAADIKACVKG